MLLLPQGNERRFEPVPQRLQPVDARMTGGAKRQQKTRVMDPGAAVMDGEFLLCPTPPAAAAVAVENRIAVAGEAPPGVRFPPIAVGAQTGSTEAGLPARTEEPGLAGGGRREEAPRGRGQTRRAFPRSDAQTSSIADGKTPYH